MPLPLEDIFPQNMKVSYCWLKEYLGDFDLSPQELADALTDVGLVVEELKPLQDDYCLDIEVTSNRPDCLGILGIAREVAAVTGSKLRLPEVDYKPKKAPIDFEVQVDDAELCPRYTARVIRGVKVGPSPSWLRKHLEAVGLRPINNVVDITNYVLRESGQPLHAFDMDKLIGKRIVVRCAVKGEALKTIDGTRCDLTPETLIIADGTRPVAIAGVMGGSDTEVGEATKNILLESARFRPSVVRRAAKRFALSTDSSYRFERGVDPEGVDWASRRATKLIQELAGGEVSRDVIDVGPKKVERSVIPLRMSQLNAVLGTQIDAATTKDILSRLGFEVKAAGKEKLNVTVPTFRGDVSREVDLIEEVARIHGYNNVPADTRLSIQVRQQSRYEQVEERTRELLVGWGLTEVITYSIVDDVQHQRFRTFSSAQALTIRNPIRKGEDRLRQTLMGNLLKVKKHNQDHGVPRVKIFEISRVYLPTNSDKLPDEKTSLCLLWEEEGVGSEKAFYALKGVVEGLSTAFGLRGVPRWQGYSGGPFDEKRSCRVELEGKVLGVLGEIKKEIVEEYDLDSSPTMAEIDFDLIVEKADLAMAFKKLPLYPQIVRDMAIVVEEQVGWADVEKCIKDARLKFLEDIEFFDLYSGKQVPAGKKSMAFRLYFRAPDRTLRGEEADEMQKLVIERLGKELGAVLR
ncbi:MAG: phenylalanine--tRNA ligase subunit beta [Candidatus Brocadiales bacterium]